MRRRNKYLPIIGGLTAFLIIYVVISVIKNLRIYFVYSTGVGPFLFVGAIILIIMFLFVKGSRSF